jgi:trans-aconitate methyltransferase
MILGYVPLDRPIRFLDLGCGTGEQLFDLSRVLPKAELVGVDISETSIHEAELKREKLFSEANLKFYAVNYLEFKSSPFDVIYSYSTLHNIKASTASLFSKIDKDLIGGGLLINAMPYACLFNYFLWTLRRLFRMIKSRSLDKIIIALGKSMHGRHFDQKLLSERLSYMYMIPYRYDCEPLRNYLEDSFGLKIIGEHSVPHASIAQPKHLITVFKKA